MPTCPLDGDPGRLNLLLSGDLPEAEQAELADHLEACEPCRKALDALSARSGLWEDLALLRDPAPDSDPELEIRDAEAEAVALLEPADAPEALGRLGRYDVLRVVGRGGMGVVFQAVDRSLDRPVAIKILAPALAATGAARRRFAREAKAAAAVVHEHVVTIHAVDATPRGIPYLVMEYVDGRSAQALVDGDRAPELAEILRIGSQAARGLAAAHAQGLIHRDIKPANLLLEDGVERVKLTDFGLARAVDDASMTQTGVVAGTPQYMSPEQARGDPVDHRTDLFSLGSVLYALCTGRAPFRGSSSLGTLRRVSEQDPEPIASHNPEIPAWLATIVSRLQAKAPADRYRSADEVADLLGRCLAHVRQPATVPLPAGLARRPGRRRVAALGTLAACVLLLASLAHSDVRAAAQEAADSLAVVLRLKTPSGVLVIETDDPGVSIRLDGSDLIVAGAGVKELKLDVGPHSVEAIRDGEVIREELVTITRGDRTLLSIRREGEGRLETAETVGRQDPIDEVISSMSARPPTMEEYRANPGLMGSSIPREKTRRPGDGAMDRGMASDLLYPGLRFAPPRGAGRFSTEPQEPGTDSPETAARRLAEALERLPAEPTEDDGRTRMQIYLRDLQGDRVTLIADEPIRGLTRTSTPTWSPDGTRIAFHATPDNDGSRSQILFLQAEDGWPVVRAFAHQGISSPNFSPDGRTIAYLKWSGPDSGTWLMQSDGSGSRRVADFGSPYWSPDGTRLMLHPFSEQPTRTRVHDLRTGEEEIIQVDGFEMISWPSWVDADTVVATLNTGADKDDERLVLLDVTDPSDSKVVRVLWERGPDQDVVPRWPAMRPSTGEFFFAGVVQEPDLRNLYRLLPDESPLAVPMQPEPREDHLGELAFSPDGRYLLFNANRRDRQLVERLREGEEEALIGRGRGVPISPLGYSELVPEPTPAEEVHRLAEALKIHPAQPSEDRQMGQQPNYRMQLYMKDLRGGEVTLVADEPLTGYPDSFSPVWSPDGTRIAFHAGKTFRWTDSELFVLEAPDGRPAVTSLGAGSSPSWSPDGTRIAFLRWEEFDSDANPVNGAWVMDADGSDRRRVADRGAPFWSPGGGKLLINPMPEPGPIRIFNLERGSELEVKVEGLQFISWPRWADDETLVATLNTSRAAGDERLVLLDVNDPPNATLKRILWQRGPGQDLLPRWPMVGEVPGNYFFIGVGEGNTRGIYRVLRGEPGPPAPAETVDATRHDGKGGLSISPDGRYLLFNANRPDRAGAGRKPEPEEELGAAIRAAPDLNLILPDPVEEADRLAQALRRSPVEPSEADGRTRMQIYMRDLETGEVTLIADESLTGLAVSVIPDWSPDGRRIAFHANPDFNYRRSQMFALEARDGRRTLTPLGPGDSPNYSPDGTLIAFAQWHGSGPDPGVWLMDAEGGDRRRVSDVGAPYWSPSGEKLLIHDFSDPTSSRIKDLATRHEEVVRVAGFEFVSWPSWVDERTLVAPISTGKSSADDRLVLLDISNPSHAEITRVLCERGPDQDVVPRWPLKRASMEEYLFVGVEGSTPGDRGDLRNLYRLSPDRPDRAVPVQDQGHRDLLGGLSFSPDGRYLLFNANRPDRR
ncbi:protein kinase domain-containing protein [Tautonia plasticadhaerens]|uniref:non-specific serine/threonine protein kinase n=1 Tax=Tautonia plasticadhaerens TaxID=2527974 RepID=A0A518H2V6_9BACT|nr:protein kinase [Tautonia plasticadhaerens]QDV35169.1 Serine/threonine-protein kinase PknB [Tautonia plasticadhaerens]